MLMKRLKDNALIGVAGVIALALIVTSSIIPGTFASESVPASKGNVSEDAVSRYPIGTAEQTTLEPVYDDSRSRFAETRRTEDDASSTDTVNVSAVHGATTIKASFTVVNPD
jgi:hypothetical protein